MFRVWNHIYVYGETIIIPDWRTALKFYSFIKYTSTPFNNEESFLTGFHVDSKYYIQALDGIFSEGIPVLIIEKSTKYITDVKDLCNFESEFIQTLIVYPGFNTEKFFPHLNLGDCFWNLLAQSKRINK